MRADDALIGAKLQELVPEAVIVDRTMNVHMVLEQAGRIRNLE